MIEEGLRLIGRQVTVCGRRIDLLFEDRFGQKLVVELKWGPIKDEHVGQVMYYQGAILSGGEPVRVMLIGTRVPPAIQRSLDFNGLAAREIRLRDLIDFVKSKGETDLVRAFEADLPLSEAAMKPKASNRAAMRAAAPLAPLSGSLALLAPVNKYWIEKAFADFERGKKKLRFGTDSSHLVHALDHKGDIHRVYFKATGENDISASARFVSIDAENPAEDRLTGSAETSELWYAKYYYGFCDLERTEPPIPLASLRRYPSGKALRNDAPGACLVF
jgi:hypothetical protein